MSKTYLKGTKHPKQTIWSSKVSQPNLWLTDFMLSSSCSRKFFSRTDVIIAGKGLQSLDLCIGHAVFEDLYRATHAVSRGLGLIDLIRRTTPYSRFLPQSRYTEVWGLILTRILMGILILKKKEPLLFETIGKIYLIFLYQRDTSIFKLIRPLWWFKIWDSVEILTPFVIPKSFFLNRTTLLHLCILIKWIGFLKLNMID